MICRYFSVRNLGLAQFLKEFVSRMLGLLKEGIFPEVLTVPILERLVLFTYSLLNIRQPVAATLSEFAVFGHMHL